MSFPSFRWSNKFISDEIKINPYSNVLTKVQEQIAFSSCDAFPTISLSLETVYWKIKVMGLPKWLSNVIDIGIIGDKYSIMWSTEGVRISHDHKDNLDDSFSCNVLNEGDEFYFRYNPKTGEFAFKSTNKELLKKGIFRTKINRKINNLRIHCTLFMKYTSICLATSSNDAW